MGGATRTFLSYLWYGYPCCPGEFIGWVQYLTDELKAQFFIALHIISIKSEEQ